ncbi:zinc finger protein GAI-ASSOCIATED FACTOR 1-like isoform X2 [Zingiber officinale]|uniref:zinc finger protein GAI-ASSOCIATED FACTOR 1-like isoform X2 n=1 Tax=Zingiber officinale TaxID=94328 RepID=UPI001C4AE630|nr:zinc finger protein GAI-ASSOCIATED FACTOR 1-like isoform X2 [Zingiber officinale]
MASASSSSPFLGIRDQEEELQNQMKTPTTPLQFHQPPRSSSPTSATAVPAVKKRRNQPRDPNPDAEVIALSPTTLLATNRFVCEVCNKGFQREQNLQLHRRGHNLPWKLRLKSSKEPPRRRVYLCPEPSCVHHDPSRALGDLTGIKKHFCRKHGEKKWKCDKCAKRYAVPSDLKAHAKTCGTREYRCDCGTLFSRRDSFITHRAFCDVLAQESTRLPNAAGIGGHLYGSNMMAMNLCQVNSQLLSSLQEQNNDASSSAAAAGAQFRQLVNPPAQFRAPAPANFYLGNGSNVVQDFDMEEHSLLQRKPFHGLMQLPDLHGNSSSGNLFDLSFFSNSGAVEGCSADPAMMFSSSLVADHAGGAMASSSLYNADSSTSAHPRMSATSLLQKAAQMGSIETSGGAAAGGSLPLAGFGVAGNPRPPPHFGGSFNTGDAFHTDMDNATSLQNIMNALANGSAGAGLFGCSAPFVESGPRHEAAVVELSSFGGGLDAPDDAEFNLAAGGLAGPDHLTRDFLGVGRTVRTASAGPMSRRELNHGTDMCAFDPK